MSYFLIVYDRAAGKQLELREFSSHEEAMREQFQREILERVSADVEVVVLGTSSIETLKRTHSRYFKSLGGPLGQLAAS